MSRFTRTALGAAILIVPVLAFAEHTIPAGQLDPRKIYWGVSEIFEKPAELRFKDVCRATVEYQELKKRKVARGTGKYWLLMSRACDRVVRTIDRFAHDPAVESYDIVAETGYFGSLNPPIPADEITKPLINFMNKKEKKPARTDTALERLGKSGIRTFDKTIGTTIDVITPVLPKEAISSVAGKLEQAAPGSKPDQEAEPKAEPEPEQ